MSPVVLFSLMVCLNIWFYVADLGIRREHFAMAPEYQDALAQEINER